MSFNTPNDCEMRPLAMVIGFSRALRSFKSGRYCSPAGVRFGEDFEERLPSWNTRISQALQFERKAWFRKQSGVWSARRLLVKRCPGLITLGCNQRRNLKIISTSFMSKYRLYWTVFEFILGICSKNIMGQGVTDSKSHGLQWFNIWPRNAILPFLLSAL